MELETVNELLEKQNGNYSLFTNIFGERLNVYSDYELPFRYEFLFFEERYLAIKKHIIQNEISQNIVDIGCQLGLQSEIFLDAESYLGIDCSKASYFMNSEKPNINYSVGIFPNDTEVDLKGKTVISSMSLGYFDSWINKDEEKARKEIVEKLKDCSILYIATQKTLVDMLSPYFETTDILQGTESGDFHLYVLQKSLCRLTNIM
jgi:hypothetical protein